MMWSFRSRSASSSRRSLRTPPPPCRTARRPALTLELLERRDLLTAGAFLQGTAFIDSNHHGTLDANDPYLPGATVSLYSASGTLLGSTTTNSVGAYLFNDSNVPGGLSPGEYTLVETPLAGYTNTGAQVLSQLDPGSVENSSTIQVTVLDPSNLYLYFNSNDFFDRNAWDYLGQTFQFTNAGVTAGSPVVMLADTNPISVGDSVTVSDGTTTLTSTVASISPNASVTLNNNWPGSTGNSATLSDPDTETAGQFPVTPETSTGAALNSQFLSFCWDLQHFLADGPNTFPVLPVSSQNPGGGAPANAGQIAYLFNHYGTVDITNAAADNSALAGANVPPPSLPTGTVAEAVGLQVAIWELEYGSTFTNLQVLESPYGSGSELSDINTWAAFYKSDAAGKSETATFLQVNGPATQGGEQGMIATGSFNFGNLLTSSVSTTIQDSGGGAPSGALGEQVYDTATVTGSLAATPTGTVTYEFFKTSNGTGPHVDQTVTLNADGTVPNSAVTAALMAGSYSYIAVYSGDSNYACSTGAVEPLTISQGSSSVTTAIFDSGGGAVTGTLGESVYDTATVSGSPAAFTPTGNVAFYFSTNGGASYSPFDTEAVGTQSINTSSLPAGSYSFEAQYLGDGNYAKSPMSAAEPFTIKQGSSSVSTAIFDSGGGSVTGTLGESVYDTATVTGTPPAFTPTGNVNYYLSTNGGPYAPFDTEPVGTPSKATGPLPAGSYSFEAQYLGDGNYAKSPMSAAEPFTIKQGSSSVTTAIFDASTKKAPGGTLGESVYDTATVTGTPPAFTPTGNVNYYLSTNGGPYVPFDTEPVGTPSKATGPLPAGSYSFEAQYLGDGNYAKSPMSAAEPFTISQGSSSVSTAIKDSGGGAVTGLTGERVYDTATVTGTPAAFTPTGTVKYEFFTTLNGTGSHVDDTVTLNANGTVPNSTTQGPLAAGSYSYIAVYSGDSNYTGYTSAVEPLTITGASISGYKYLDPTGNGFSAAHTGLGGVTIDLYTGKVGGTLVATTTTASGTGAYSFTGLAAGAYYVQEVVPTGDVQTGGGPNGSAGCTYYTVTVAAGHSCSGYNFADYVIPTCTPTSVSFAVDNNNCITTVSDLRGETQQGDAVTVTFKTGSMTDQLTLVSYIAPAATFDSSTAYEQQIFDEASGTFAANGTYSLTVLIPNCYYQIDFVCGPAISELGPPTYKGNAYGPDSANIFYSAQDRLISADNGGTQAFSNKSISSGDFGTTALWTSTNGVNLLDKLNGSSTSTQLAQWLAQTFPNLYGPNAGPHSLVNPNGSYFTNAQVATAYAAKFSGNDQQVLSAALSVYATSINLAGASVASYAKTTVGLNTSAAGSGMDTYNVTTNGAAFGLANNTTQTVMQLLGDLNAVTAAGAAVSSGAGAVFTCINTAGNVKNADTGDGLAYSPDQVRTAYGINDLSLDGTGQTIAIVDAYDNPAIFQSLDAFDAQFSSTTGGPSLYSQYGPASSFLTVLNQDGQASPLPATDPTGAGGDNWEVEESLDVEWAHAMAPGAQIILVEANGPSLSDLMSAVVTAANQPGVSVVSMSWGFTEGQTVLAQDEALYDADFTTPAAHQGVTFVASTGDYGTLDPEYPAFSPNVVAVGGTSLTLNGDNSYKSETGWGYFNAGAGALVGGGGGASLYESEPTYQLGVQSTGYRTTPDVSFVADPADGAWVADSYNLSAAAPFEVVGGTSWAAPSWAGLIALADQGRAAAGESTLASASDPTATQEALYSIPAGDYNAVTSGSNGDYTAGAGYNLVTGLGTPQANLLIPDLIAYTGPIDFAAETGNVTVTAATIAGAGGPGSISESVFDAMVVAAPGAFGAHTTMTSSPAAADSPATLAAPADAPLTQDPDAPGTPAVVSATVPTSGLTTELADALLATGVVNVAPSGSAGGEAGGAGLATSPSPSGADQAAAAARVRASAGMVADAIFGGGNFQATPLPSIVPAGVRTNAAASGAAPAALTAAGPAAVGKESPAAPFFPCDAVFTASNNGLPVHHAQGLAMLDRADAAGRTVLSAAGLVVLLQGARDAAARHEAERRRPRFARPDCRS